LAHYTSKERNTVFIIIATATLLVALAFQFSSLNTGSYAVNKKDIFKIDSVRMLSRAFLLTGKNNRGIEFEDEKRKTFIISGTRYDVISEKLYDTLQYSDLVMSVFTDKTGAEKYRNKDNNDKIEVYNIQIGETSFIDLNRINKQEYNNRQSTIIFISAAYCFAAVYYFRQRKKK
jgi:hypothetical protein